MNERYRFADFDEIIKLFPDQADTLIVDAYLTDSAEASMRLFRIYHPLPRHYHTQCDEHLLLLRGELEFLIEDEPPRKLRAGQMVSFLRNVVHGVRPIGTDPVVFFAADTPRRAPDDVHFVDPEAAKGLKFVSHLKDYANTLA
ncbi:cupin domain-containing protein [Gluconacetobacter entanii]|nr:cupin domain-containing protein [Gluconacetobacter entanii]MBE7618321.1 cupin domain-containing protein [Komagataeibacter sp. FXV2]MBY4640637.1 cupin domain-containing protein [Gluconacetobacter entanii]NPC90148.1 cupin domain-containing protein [Gluconacetobacter entanii]